MSRVEWVQDRMAEGYWIPLACFILLVFRGIAYYGEGLFFPVEQLSARGSTIACSPPGDSDRLIKSLIISDTFGGGDRYEVNKPIYVNGKVCFDKFAED